jgi:hypothetical protein
VPIHFFFILKIFILLHQRIDAIGVRPNFMPKIVLPTGKRGKLLKRFSIETPTKCSARTCAWASHSATVQRPMQVDERKEKRKRRKEKGINQHATCSAIL